MSYDDRPWIQSYDQWVDPDLEIPDVHCVELFNQACEEFPDRAAYHFLGGTTTFAEFRELSLRLANFLVESGLEPGNVVAINLPNIPQYLIALAGTLLAGCTVTGLSPLLTPKEMDYQLNDSGARVLVTLDAIFDKKFLKIRERVPGLKHLVITNLADFLPGIKRFLGKLLKKVPTGSIRPIAGKSVITFKRLLGEFIPAHPNVRIYPEATALIQYTGGTTGVPKGTLLTHRNLVANYFQVKQWTNIERGCEVCCSAFPFFHQAGLTFGMLVLAMGNTQILIPNPRDTRHICKEIDRYRPTVLCNVPTLYQMLLKEPRFKSLDFSACKFCISGASPFPAKPLKELDTVVGEGKVVEVYGMTEASPLIAMNPCMGRKRIGTVGLPIQNTLVKIVDLGRGDREVPVGEEGELILRGPQVMPGYHNQPDETAKTLRRFQGETWLFTGDVARMDQDGFITLVDRTKDMLIVSGFKVFSQEVEDTLQLHPAVELCAIIGLPDPDRPGNELVKVVIQPAPNYREIDEQKLKAEIIGYCRDNLAPFKVPKIIEFVTELPLTAVGKVDKKALRLPTSS